MQIIAHRGASMYAPENTLSSFKTAIDQDAHSIELDVRLTKDNIPVIIHDATINRVSNGKGFVHNLTLNELKTYDFGAKFSSDFIDEQIPTLQEVCELVKDTSIELNIELKNGPIIPKDLELNVLKIVNHYKLESRTLFSSFDHKCLYRLSKLNRNLNFALIFHINLINLFDYIDQIPFQLQSIHPNHFYVTEEIIEQAHQRQIKVNSYTVNDKKLAKKYKKIGMDGLITNDPLIFK